jgi:hypothetical protein
MELMKNVRMTDYEAPRGAVPCILLLQPLLHPEISPVPRSQTPSACAGRPGPNG